MTTDKRQSRTETPAAELPAGASTNRPPSANWRPGQRKFRERKSVEHTLRHGARSIMRSVARRDDFDVADLEHLAALKLEVDAALVIAARQLNARGFSWAEIARPLGITRQTAHERFG
jgi:hypothetical protein